MKTIEKVEFEALRNMPFDMEICGRLYYQAKELLLSQGFNLFNQNDEVRDKFINTLLDVMIKFTAMKYHLESYEKHELKLIERLKADCSDNEHIAYKGYELLYELEAFLFQMKSALDLSVKLVAVLFPNRFQTKTFGDKGEKLIKGLNSFKEQKGTKTEVVNSIISMIREDQETWLRQAVSLRDTLSHYKTIAGYHYQAKAVGTEIEIIYPKISGLIAIEYMKVTYSNSLEFVQDFMCLMIELFMPSKLGISSILKEHVSVGEPLNQYIKFGINIETTEVKKA
jgi:hypothetical protein